MQSTSSRSTKRRQSGYVLLAILFALTVLIVGLAAAADGAALQGPAATGQCGSALPAVLPLGALPLMRRARRGAGRARGR